MGVTGLYEIVAAAEPGDVVSDGPECEAYGEAPAPGSRETPDGDVVCSRPPGHDGPHFDGWCRASWEAVR